MKEPRTNKKPQRPKVIGIKYLINFAEVLLEFNKRGRLIHLNLKENEL